MSYLPIFFSKSYRISRQKILLFVGILLPLMSFVTGNSSHNFDQRRGLQCDEKLLEKEIAHVNRSAYWRQQILTISKELQGYHLPPCNRSKIREEGLYLFAVEARNLPPSRQVFNTKIENFELAPEGQGAANSFVFKKILAQGTFYPSLRLETDNFVIHDLPTNTSSPWACSPKALIASVKAAIPDLLNPQNCPSPSALSTNIAAPNAPKNPN